MVRDVLHTVIGLAVVAVIIVGCFKLYKYFHHRVTLEAGDNSMGIDYKPGSYRLTQSPTSIKELEGHPAVAYYTPGNSEVLRVGWVAAVAGQTVSIVDQKVLIEGKPFIRTVGNVRVPNMEILVPQASVFVLNTSLYEDSSKHGPLPVEHIAGKLR